MAETRETSIKNSFEDDVQRVLLSLMMKIVRRILELLIKISDDHQVFLKYKIFKLPFV